MRGNKGFTLIELVMIIVILGILSVVAIPRYINMQSEAREASGEAYIGALNSAISNHIADHYLRGTAYVKDAKEATALLEKNSKMPDGMTLKDTVWSVDGGSYKYTFVKAKDSDPPRIDRSDAK